MKKKVLQELDDFTFIRFLIKRCMRMQKRNSWGWIFILIAILVCYGSAVMADEEIKLSTTTIRPGDFIKIVTNEPAGSVVEVQFLDTKKQLQIYNNQYIGLIAASYFTTPGPHTLYVKVLKDNQTYTKEYTIEVAKREFPEDRVIISEKDRKKILTPTNVDADSKKVTEVKQKAQIEPLPPLWAGKFIWPVRGKVTTEFGLIRYMNNIEEGRHSGLDIAAPTGTPVLACNRGKVIFAGTLYLTGLTVIVNHGLDLYTSYCHLSRIAVKEGNQVNQGESIGQVGKTGLATGAHLHLTIRIGDICVDPYLFFDREVNLNF
jgi:murein DD-endopeptidase MepM/ murein hydrolase activator NlpD